MRKINRELEYRKRIRIKREESYLRRTTDQRIEIKPIKNFVTINRLTTNLNVEDERYKLVTLDGNDINTFFDTGSDINLLDAETHKERGFKKDKCSNIEVRNVFGPMKELNECCYITVNHDDVLVTGKF